MTPIRTGLMSLLMLFSTVASAGFFDKSQAQSDFLSVDEAFVFETVALDEHHIQARWTIAEDHYLYKHRLKVEQLDSNGNTLSWQAPDGDSYYDEHFGEVEIYHNMLEFPITVEGQDKHLTLRFHWQGCAEAGLCYPPQKRDVTFEMTP